MYPSKHALQHNNHQHVIWAKTCKYTRSQAISLKRLQDLLDISCSRHCSGHTSLAVCLEHRWLRELLFQEFADVSRVSNLLAIELQDRHLRLKIGVR